MCYLNLTLTLVRSLKNTPNSLKILLTLALPNPLLLMLLHRIRVRVPLMLPQLPCPVQANYDCTSPP